MNINTAGRTIINLFFLIIICTNCSSQVNIPDKISGMLLYIEDLDGEGGNMDGDYSDIIAFDVNNKQKYTLTNDAYYDNYPTYSKSSNRIYFESKRINYTTVKGMGAQSSLFFIDLDEKVIRSFIEEEKESLDGGVQEVDLMYPVANPVNNQLLFRRESFEKYLHSQLIWYDNTTHEYEQLLDSLNLSFKFAWNEDGTKIACQQSDTGRTYSLSLFDIKTHEVEKIVHKPRYLNYLGDYKYNKLLYIEKIRGDSTTQSICIFDIGKNKDTNVGNVLNMGFTDISTPVFKNEREIYFIGEKVIEEKLSDDIYEMDLNTGKITQITSNGKLKDSLRYYE